MAEQLLKLRMILNFEKDANEDDRVWFCRIAQRFAHRSTGETVPLFGNAVKHFVAKLVKSFGGLRNAAESLDAFRYRKVCFQQRKMLHSVPLFGKLDAWIDFLCRFECSVGLGFFALF